MNRSLLVRSGLRHYRRMHAAVGLGVMVACATLTGALLVGDCLRGSLRAQALARLGRVRAALLAPRFFRAALVEAAPAASAAPVILMHGGARHPQHGTRSHRVAVIGADERSWSLLGVAHPPSEWSGRVAALNASLAAELGAAVGDDVLIDLTNPSEISIETLLGRRDESALSLRAWVAGILPDAAGGGFALQPTQAAPRNVFVPLSTLQRTVRQNDRVNALLVGGGRESVVADASWRQGVSSDVTIADYGLRLRGDGPRGYVALESDALLLSPVVEAAARGVAEELKIEASPVLTYLATAIGRGGEEESVPYSVVAAMDAGSPTYRALRDVDGTALPEIKAGEVLLNEWTARQLGVKPGDRVTLAYLMTGPFGRLEERTADFVLRGVVAMDAAGADPGFAPDYPGITDAKSLAAWNPPFPMDMRRIGPSDEAYWEKYRTAPKAVVALEEGQRLWVDQPERFGRLTAVRFHVPAGGTMEDVQNRLAQSLRARLTPEAFGFEFLDVRRDAMEAARGSTDFGMLFIGFSLFLIAAAVMLTALLFRLGVERRSSEMGLLLAVGYRPRAVLRLFLSEGMRVSVIGVAVGLVVALGYAWLMLAGLRSWWSAAANAPFLALHVRPLTCLVGAGATLLAAYGSLAWSVRGLAGRAPRRLLSGDVEARPLAGASSGGRAGYVALTACAVAGALATYAVLAPGSAQAPIFFGSGAALLIAALAAARGWMGRAAPVPPAVSGRAAWVRLGVRNAPRHPGRSLLTMALMGSAVFLLVAVGAFRVQPPEDVVERTSGFGGYALLAESAVPVPYDLNTPSGRESLGFPPESEGIFAYARIEALRLRGGDEASCLSLYRAREPRLLGAGEAFLQRGGFRFAASLARTDEERANPWLLLKEPLADGAVAVIGDEAAVTWQLKSGLGRDLVIRDERGAEVRLRFVALLSGSILQSEVVMAESALTRHFPSVAGYRFFLIAAPAERRAAVAEALESALERYSFDATPTTERLAAYLAVQNTYLGTFQTLGGLGLILGSAGLGVVMLRNIAERRGELALLRALGFTRRALGWMVFSENALLTVGGLACGLLPAVVAIGPQLPGRAPSVPLSTLGMLLLGVVLVGLASGLAALRATLRAPLLRALRQE